jgi:hypothetical protein
LREISKRDSGLEEDRSPDLKGMSFQKAEEVWRGEI